LLEKSIIVFLDVGIKVDWKKNCKKMARFLIVVGGQVIIAEDEDLGITMDAQNFGGFESFRTLRAEKLGAVIFERCRESGKNAARDAERPAEKFSQHKETAGAPRQ